MQTILANAENIFASGKLLIATASSTKASETNNQMRAILLSEIATENSRAGLNT